MIAVQIDEPMGTILAVGLWAWVVLKVAEIVLKVWLAKLKDTDKGRS